MDYLRKLNAFRDWCACTGPRQNLITLYYGLLQAANLARWAEPFYASLSVLQAQTGMSRDAIFRTRHQLVEAGLIEVCEGHPGQSAQYRLLPLPGEQDMAAAKPATTSATIPATVSATTSATTSATVSATIPIPDEIKQEELDQTNHAPQPVGGAGGKGGDTKKKDMHGVGSGADTSPGATREPEAGTITAADGFAARDGRFVLPEGQAEAWQLAFPMLDVRAQLDAAAAWLAKHPGHRPRMRNAKRFLERWLDNRKGGASSGHAAGRTAGSTAGTTGSAGTASAYPVQSGSPVGRVFPLQIGYPSGLDLDEYERLVEQFVPAWEP